MVTPSPPGRALRRRRRGRAVRELANNHSAYYLDHSVVPAPTLISNGFTDDLFPVDEAVRWVNRVKAKHPKAPVAQLHFDYGHARGQSKAADQARLRARTHEWFDRYVKGERVTDAPRRRGADADVPEERAVGRPLLGAGRGTPSAPARCAIATTRPRSCSRPRAIRPSELGWTRSSAAAPAWRYPRPTRPARRPIACRPPPGRATPCSARPPSSPASGSRGSGRRSPRGCGTWRPAVPRRRWWRAGCCVRTAAGERCSSSTPTDGILPPATWPSSSCSEGTRPYAPPVELPVVDQRLQAAPPPAGARAAGQGCGQAPEAPAAGLSEL